MLQRRLAAIGIFFLAAAISASAHHGWPEACSLDPSKSQVPIGGFTGKVLTLEFRNPHSSLSIELKDVDGKARKPRFELTTPEKLQMNGWDKRSLKPGDTVTVIGCLSRAYPDNGVAWEVVVAGKKLIVDKPRF
jgi:hypothetical protein